MTDIGIHAPHGPDMTGTQDPLESMKLHEREAFDTLLRPEDSYTPEGVYWADLPIKDRVAFITRYDARELKLEVKYFWDMFRADPLQPLRYYFRNFMLPGAGLGLEGYVLFSIGNVKPLFSAIWKECWQDHTTCNKTWIAAVEYLEICGIIVGQILVGFIGDWLGLRWGLIQDAAVMLLGLLMLTASWGTSLEGFVICYAWSLFVYGVGVGGEYPMTATSGMENAANAVKVSTKDDRLHRGRKVTSAFLMQGWGQLFNQALLIILLLCFHHGSGNPSYSAVAVQWTFRVSFAIPAIGTLWLVYYRMYKMPLSSKRQYQERKNKHVTGYDKESLRLTVKHFGSRLFATAAAWFANDIFFYGNKLFQSEFIKVITNGSKSVMPGWLYNLINVGVSLAGYYSATFLIDNKLYGRRRMQMFGFLMDFILFIIPAFHYNYYTSSGHVKAFQAMYFLSSYFNQFGPNSVTFLVAAEVFPTPIRASAHGFSAGVGKMGALMASILYSYIDTQTKFYVVPWFGLAGMIITFVFLPDTTGLDLKEQERRWHFIRAGKSEEYKGISIHPRHLSLWERFRGVHKNYDAEVDYRQKVEEMRRDWLTSMEQQYAAENENETTSSETEKKVQRKDAGNGEYFYEYEGDNEKDENMSTEDLQHRRVNDYFQRTSPMMAARTPKTPQVQDKTPLETLEELPPPEIPPPARDEAGNSREGGVETMIPESRVENASDDDNGDGGHNDESEHDRSQQRR